MPKLTVTLTDAQYAALSDAAVDPKAWLQNAAEARASAAAAERQLDPAWPDMVVAVAAAGGDHRDPVAVLAHGIAAGRFKAAAARQAEAEAKAAAELAAREAAAG